MTGRSQKLIDRDARMAEMASAGKTASEIASAETVGIQSVYKWAQLAGIKLVHARAKAGRASRIARAEKMAGMYRQGITLAKIGDQFGMTRERVRQILSKNGVQPGDGGGSLVAKARRAAGKQARETRYLVKYGLPLEVVQQLQKDRVTHAFGSQRQSAKNRGVVWNLTFAQWFAVWQSSGKLHLRGRGKGKYVMSRVSDAGCYELGNVHIQLATENSKEAVSKWKGKTKANRGVFCLYPGREMAWHARVGKTSLGFYKTEAEAVAARAAFLEDHPEIRDQTKGRGYAVIRGKDGRQNRYQVMVGKKYVGSYLTPEAALAARAAYIASQAAAQPAEAKPTRKAKEAA